MINEKTGAIYHVSAGTAIKQKLYELMKDYPTQFIFLVRYIRGEEDCQYLLNHKLLAKRGLMARNTGDEELHDWVYSDALEMVIKEHVFGNEQDMHVEG